MRSSYLARQSCLNRLNVPNREQKEGWEIIRNNGAFLDSDCLFLFSEQHKKDYRR